MTNTRRGWLARVAGFIGALVGGKAIAPVDEVAEQEIGDTGGWTPDIVRVYAHSDNPRDADGQPTQRSIREFRVGQKWCDVHVHVGPHSFHIKCEYEREHCFHRPGTPDGYLHVTVRRDGPGQFEREVLGRYRIKAVPRV